MFTFVRTADVRDGQILPAIEWALKVSGYLNDKFGLNIIVQRNLTGKTNQLHWVDNHDSLSRIEEVGAAIFADEEYQQMVADANERGLFFGQSIEDNIYQSIP